MSETNIPQPPPPPQPGQGQPAPAEDAESLRAQLAKVRRRNKVLIMVAAVCGTLLVMLFGAGYMVYMRLGEVGESVSQSMRAFEQQPPAAYQQENSAIPGQGVRLSTYMPVSSLGLFSGGMPGNFQENFDPAQAERMMKAVNKYADRPIVKAFMADLKQIPEVAAAFKDGPKGNPMAAFASLQNAKGMDKVMMKYALRPDFMKLLMEVMADPEMKPFMNGMPPGMALPLPGTPRQGPAVPVNTRPAPAPEPEGEDEGEMTFDPSAISGPAKEAPVRSKKLPPPVDTD